MRAIRVIRVILVIRVIRVVIVIRVIIVMVVMLIIISAASISVCRAGRNPDKKQRVPNPAIPESSLSASIAA